MTLSRKLLAEALGTMLLLATIVGSGIAGGNLAQGNAAIALLANAGAVACIFYVTIGALGPVSGAHFNPAVTIAMRLRGAIGTGDAIAYILVQVAAAIAGVVLAHAMFGLALVQTGSQSHTGTAQLLSEAVGTFGLVLAIVMGVSHSPKSVPSLVAAVIFAASWFTPSGGFVNPAVTLARALTQTGAGIVPGDVPGFIVAQLLGMLLAVVVTTVLAPREEAASAVSGLVSAHDPVRAQT